MYSINLALHFYRNTSPFAEHLVDLTPASCNMGIIEHRGIKTALLAISFAGPGTRTETWFYACITSFYASNTPPGNTSPRLPLRYWCKRPLCCSTMLESLVFRIFRLVDMSSFMPCSISS